MAITIEQVIAVLDRDEPNYPRAAARFGEDALPHLMRLVEEDNPGRAAKAAYLAGLINGKQSAAILEKAARSPHSVVRVAAASALRLISEIPVPLVIRLLNDEYIGTRKQALKSLEVQSPSGVKAKVQEMAKSDSDETLRQLASQILNRVH